MSVPDDSMICLAGPTGVGKTALALELADRLGAEIVGADAFQIYEGLPVLTAQASAEDRARIPHHLVGCVPVSQTFDAHRYRRAAQEVLREIRGRGRRALVVGGTGLYFRALIDGLAEAPPPNPALREEMARLELPALVERLRVLDPDAQVDFGNRRRVERAIEILEGSGQKLADFRRTPRRRVPGLFLVRERDQLRERIHANVHRMLREGAIEEVARLRPEMSPTAARAIGVREIEAHLRGEMTLEACEAAIAQTTRQYAKRQLTWFRNQTTFATLELTPSCPAVESALKLLALA